MNRGSLLEEGGVPVVIVRGCKYIFPNLCEKTKQLVPVSTLYSYIIITLQNIYNYPLRTHLFSRIKLSVSLC